MSRTRQNTTQRNGKKVLGSWKIYCTLSCGSYGITLKGVKSKRIANQVKHKVNEIERLSKQFPNQKDWLKETYIACGREDMIPNYNDLIPNIKEGFEELISTKQLHKEITKQKTIDAYLYAKSLMLKVIGNISVNQISSMHKVQIEKELHSRDYSDNTINIYSRNIMQFLSWCVEHEYIDKLPFKIKQIKVVANKKTWIKKDEFDLITSKMDKVSRAYAVVSYHTGLRKSELNDNKYDKAYNGLYHTLKIKDNLYQLCINGKGGKYREVPLMESIKDEYDIMVKNRLHPTTISKKFKKACIKVGLPHYHFHHLRHSFSSNLTMITQDAYLISTAMGHSSLNTTQKYLNDKTLKWSKLVESEVFKA